MGNSYYFSRAQREQRERAPRSPKGNIFARIFGGIAAFACIVTLIGYVAFILNVQFSLYNDAAVLDLILPWLLRAPFISIAACLFAFGCRRRIAGFLIFLVLAAGLVFVTMFPEVAGLPTLSDILNMLTGASPLPTPAPAAALLL